LGWVHSPKDRVEDDREKGTKGLKPIYGRSEIKIREGEFLGGKEVHELEQKSFWTPKGKKLKRNCGLYTKTYKQNNKGKREGEGTSGLLLLYQRLEQKKVGIYWPEEILIMGLNTREGKEIWEKKKIYPANNTPELGG